MFHDSIKIELKDGKWEPVGGFTLPEHLQELKDFIGTDSENDLRDYYLELFRPK